MKKVTLVFPHQLFEKNPAVIKNSKIYLIEESLFFLQYAFHKSKIAFHRASMKFYESFLKNKKYDVEYINTSNRLSDIRELIPHLKLKGVDELNIVEPCDNWLEKRIKNFAESNNIKVNIYTSPMFQNSPDELESFFVNKKKLRQSEFYIQQRKKRKILINEDNTPIGGKWSFDKENRAKYPSDKSPPDVKFPKINPFVSEAGKYTQKYFTKNFGTLSKRIIYPVTFADSKKWLDDFLTNRFKDFGDYEDAIVEGENILNHSLLSPLLNIGLLTPAQVLDSVINHGKNNSIPLNSLEGFVRQLIGWREFVRGVYHFRGTEERNHNFWNFERKMPASFYNASTGIDPVDNVIKKVLETGYCHHIERLMILGNFMLLCEIHPDEVYKWFMELFIDAYDWVMVPNVYGMSQFADGGLLATKPYISGSNYIMKMSNYKKGEWQKIWDSLFWRFMDLHRDFFLKNPRLGMLVRSFDKMPAEKRKSLIETAERYLQNLK